MVEKTIAHYEVLDEIGVGGMGVVYRARDTRLDREAAIKALPEELADDPERLARFEREAKLLASLKNPYIATVYGLEEVEGRRFLAMELVEGESLAERLSKGALPVPEALELARQIAEALEAAHKADVIHRDVKPGNIMIDTHGKAKVLDFGLAKTLTSEEPEVDLSLSPTLAQPMTQAGQVLGTPVYMSPEQVKGQEAGKQSDIWAFGCVLYEMLAGKRTFAGPILGDAEVEADWEALPARTPVSVRSLIRRCLRQDLHRRLHNIADARIEISDELRDPESQRNAATASDSRHRASPVPTLAKLIAGALIGLAGGLWLGTAWRQPPEATSQPTAAVVVRTEIDLPPGAPLGFGTNRLGFDSPQIAVSPNGTLIVYVGKHRSGTLLYRRPVNSFDDPEPIEGTEGALFAFFSPKGDWLGFLTKEEVKKVSLSEGDRPQTVSRARVPTHAAWVASGTILFTEDEGFTLSSVPEAGGTVTEIGSLALGTQTYLSDVLPDGKHALIQTSQTSIGKDYANIYLLSLDTLERTLLVERGYDARYVPTGHLLFARSGTLYAVAFDRGSLKVSGDPLPVVPDVSMESLFGQVQVAFSDNGTLVYVRGGDGAVGKIASVDRSTQEVEFLDLPEQVYGYFELSPDGSRIAVQVADVRDYIVIWDRMAKTERRVVAAGNAGWPRWRRDGGTIAFSTMIPGEGHGIFTTAADRETDPRLLFTSETRVFPCSWHPGGDRLGVYSFDGRFRFGFLKIGDKTVDWASRLNASEATPNFSREGRWFAHTSNRTGRYEVRVRSYPGDEFDQQISSNGGIEPNVCSGCDELFYRDGNRWFAHTITPGQTIEFGPARLAFETDFIDTPGRSYDVSADGQQLFVVKRTREQVNTKLHVVVNWFEELKRAVPAH